MPRIEPLTLENAPEASRAVMENIKKKFGKVPNIFATLAASPAALKTLMNIFAALDGGSLSGKPHEAIALRVGQMHGCRYCSAAHTAKAKMAGASAEEAIDFRKGIAEDQKLQCMLDLAASMVNNRGQVTDQEVNEARQLGVSDAELLEIAAIVACNTLTNYVNALAQTEVDFPPAPQID